MLPLYRYFSTLGLISSQAPVALDNPEALPIGVGLLDFQSTTDAVSTNQLAAATVLSTLPALVIFTALQRFIIGAMTAGAVKG